ncbi:hypothetical protein KDA14_04700 [Candidatus Saccharibacteria bacterium]|nr:hypothetical protein [Candidatus Saccharibacteria bacterium]
MVKKALHREILLLVVPIAVILLTAVVVVVLQSKSSVWAPSVEQEGSVIVKGTALCLPHKDTSGPQTLACALGIKDEKGQYYAIGDTDSTYKNVSKLPMGKEVEVRGTFVKGDNDIYPTIGTIKVTKVTPL